MKNTKKKDSLRDLCDNITNINIYVIGVPEEEVIERRGKNTYFKK